MPILYAARTSLRKLRRKRMRMFFGIVPTVLLLTFIVLFSTISVSVNTFIRTHILSKIEYREEIIHLSKLNNPAQTYMPTPSPLSSDDNPNDYTQSDVDKVKTLNHIQDAQAERILPTTSATTASLVAGKTLTVDGFTLAPQETARDYDATSFTYSAGQPIPIIVNKAMFNRRYLDMGGKSTITITGEQLADPQKSLALVPVKSEFLDADYNKSKMLGRTFQMKLGGLPAIPMVALKSTFSGTSGTDVYRTLSTSDIAKLQKTQNDAIGPYWDQAKLAEGVTAHFVIVGVNETPGDSKAIIPTTAGIALFQELYTLQRGARTHTALPAEAYSSSFAGERVTKTGKLSDNGADTSYNVTPGVALLTERTSTDSPPAVGPTVIPIPGWVYRNDEKDGATVSSDVPDFILTADKLSITGITVRLDNATNRPKAQKALATAGYPEADNSASFTDTIRKVNGGLGTALLVVVAILAGINALILISTVGRSVADSQREIGVYRALGARKRDVAKLYVVYSAIQTALGIALGLILGLVLIFPVASWLTAVIAKLGFTQAALDNGVFGGLNLAVKSADFYHIDVLRIGLYAIALMVLTIVVSLIPAWRAARISPVEAIRKAD